MSENLSSLVDGEAEISQADIESIKNDPKIAKKWKNYHLIKDVMQDSAPVALPKDFSKSVMLAISQEPVVLAPKPGLIQKSWLRPAAGLAVAATVALATIGGMQTLWQSDAGEQPALLSQSVPVPPTTGQSLALRQLNTRPAVYAQPVSVTGSAGVPVANPYNQSFSSNLQWKRIAPTDIAVGNNSADANKKMAEELNKLLMNHVRSAGSAGSAGSVGVLPYARLAGYDDN